jgi:hypothetical protein
VTSLSLVVSVVSFFFLVAVIILQPLPPLPPYVRSSRAALDKNLSILSVVVGAGASTLPAPPLCAVSFRLVGGRPLSKVVSKQLYISYEYFVRIS